MRLRCDTAAPAGGPVRHLRRDALFIIACRGSTLAGQPRKTGERRCRARLQPGVDIQPGVREITSVDIPVSLLLSFLYLQHGFV